MKQKIFLESDTEIYKLLFPQLNELQGRQLHADASAMMSVNNDFEEEVACFEKVKSYTKA